MFYHLLVEQLIDKKENLVNKEDEYLVGRIQSIIEKIEIIDTNNNPS